MRLVEEGLYFSVRECTMFQIKPDAVKTEMCRMWDEWRDVVLKAAYFGWQPTVPLWKSFAFSHTKVSFWFAEFKKYTHNYQVLFRYKNYIVWIKYILAIN